jgi:hypothetical protein
MPTLKVSARFCLPLTQSNRNGNRGLVTVGVMSTADLHLRRPGLDERPGIGDSPSLGVRRGLGVRPGESSPAGMLGGVLLLLVVLAVFAVLGMVWWLV